MLSLHVVIETTRSKLFSKYLKGNALGDVLTKPNDIRTYLEVYISRD